MKQLVKKIISSFGLEVKRLHSDRFTVDGLQYIAEPCSVGLTREGEAAALGAVRMIKEKGDQDLYILDICCGVGIIGLTIFARLNKESAVSGAAFADINIFNIYSLRKSITLNKLSHLIDDKINIYLSEGLSHIPRSEKFDIIISNPPHYAAENRMEDKNSLSVNKLSTYDADWEFHKKFYSEAHNYLTDRGEIWFYENNSAATDKDFIPFIETNKNLSYVKQMDEPLNPRFFWMMTKKV